MKFKVTITEILKREIEVEAETAKEAIDKASDKYWHGHIVLDSQDYEDTIFETEEDE